MFKQDQIGNPASCLNKAAVDEPVFVLRAKDPLATWLVNLWSEEALVTGIHERERATEARAVAEAMNSWRRKHYSLPETKPREVELRADQAQAVADRLEPGGYLVITGALGTSALSDGVVAFTSLAKFNPEHFAEVTAWVAARRTA